MLSYQHKASLAIAALVLAAQASEQKKGAKMAADGKVVLFEDFSSGMDNWWVEGGEKVWVQDGRLHVKADPPQKGPGHVATVWCKTPTPADLKVEFDACVIGSSLDVNNINFFMCYADPSGKPIFDTRDSRRTADYKFYHSLNGHIFTFLKAPEKSGQVYADGTRKGRIRMRRCPGFELMTECFDYRCEAGVTYHVTITKRGGDIAFGVDGRVFLRGHDPNPLPGGLIGLRTFRTELWWDNIRVTGID